METELNKNNLKISLFSSFPSLSFGTSLSLILGRENVEQRIMRLSLQRNEGEDSLCKSKMLKAEVHFENLPSKHVCTHQRILNNEIEIKSIFAKHQPPLANIHWTKEKRKSYSLGLLNSIVFLTSKFLTKSSFLTLSYISHTLRFVLSSTYPSLSSFFPKTSLLLEPPHTISLLPNTFQHSHIILPIVFDNAHLNFSHR